MSLLCLLLDSILAPCSLPLAARACRSTAFQPPCIFILDKPLAGCTFFVPRSPCVPAAPAFPKPRRKPGSQAATGRSRGWEGQGCHPGGKARTNGLTGADSGEQSGRASRSPRIPLTSPFSVHIFALLLPPLPAAVYCSPSAIVRSAAGSNPPSSVAGPLYPRR